MVVGLKSVNYKTQKNSRLNDEKVQKKYNRHIEIENFFIPDKREKGDNRYVHLYLIYIVQFPKSGC